MLLRPRLVWINGNSGTTPCRIECLKYFTVVGGRQQSAPANDLISMLAHGESTKHMAPMEFLGNLLLLIAVMTRPETRFLVVC